MTNEITVTSQSDFQEMLDNKDFKIAKIIVETILKNIDNPKSNIHILTITCLDENTSYDISLEKKYFASTLEENLKYYIKEELYEKCTQIVEVINKLKTNK
jgi:hypothetical protein